jgi:hypothetical protein
MSDFAEEQDAAVAGDVSRLDTGTAHIARVYDYWLGRCFR